MGKSDKIINTKIAATMLGISATTLRRQNKNGKGPPRVWISDNRVGYRESELQAFIASRPAENSNNRQQ